MKRKLSLPLLLGFCLTLLFSCQENKKEEGMETAQFIAPIQKPEPVIKYGFDLDNYELEFNTIQNGDSFGKIMGNLGYSMAEIFNITEKVKDSFNSAKIIAGKPYILVRNKDEESDKLAALIYQSDIVNYTVLHLEDSIVAQNKKHPVSIKRRTIAGLINSSLSQAMDDAGAGASLIHGLSSLYQWKIDFFRLQKGDKFKAVYYEKYVNDTVFAGVEKIEAAEFTHHGSPYYAFHYGYDDDGLTEKYFDDEAKSLQSFFLKAPVKYTRISSRYSLRRFHPVQKQWKGHLGTDYAAPTGTPIHSTADGVVVASSYTRGNGNYVKVQHNSTYTTQYLHMSKRAAKIGQRVKQGDVIGYVGQTGLATGPHVCYRFWVNGVQKDPYAEKMPSSEPLAENLIPEYLEYITPLKEELDNIIIPDPIQEEQLAAF